MDLGLNGRTAIVCAASQGLGKASAMALAREGVHLVIAARRREVLEGAADEIAAATGNRPKTVIADVTTAEGRDAILAACPTPDILINNAGGPPPGDFRKFEREDWIKALDGNMLAPIALIKATLDGMIVRKFGRIVNVTSHAVKSPVAMLALSNAQRAHRFCCGIGTLDCRAQCDDQQSAARHFRYRPAKIKSCRAGEEFFP
jgi:3-oxoacyl-[acyl-carrier protein] reductase